MVLRQNDPNASAAFIIIVPFIDLSNLLFVLYVANGALTSERLSDLVCCSIVEPLLKHVSQRVLLLVGDNDLLIPSKEEGPRLKERLPRCRLRVSQPSVPDKALSFR